MRGLKTAVKIWKKEIEFKLTTWGISPEHRANYRKMRQEAIRHAKMAMIGDLLNRHQVGDLKIYEVDLIKLRQLKQTPIFDQIEEIYRRYL